jgi:DNA-3-methyladenine glycosylase I
MSILAASRQGKPSLDGTRCCTGMNRMNAITTDGGRCWWARREPEIAYHDQEWGVPVHDDRTLFEFLILEGAQAGLSWETVLRKREHYRRVFDGFDPAAVARYDAAKVAALLADPGIIRNRAKVAAAIQNARATLEVQNHAGSLDTYLWQFVDGRPRRNAWRTPDQVPARTPESDAMSKDLKHRGFAFVGSTICYALMQATGMVNDHLVTCPRHTAIG